MTPTSRTLEWARSKGWVASVAEYWQPSFAQRAVVDAAQSYASGRRGDVVGAVKTLRSVGPGKRQDLFGFIDVVALTGDGILGIQCTSTSSLSAREKKLSTECRDNVLAWLNSGGFIYLVGWKKYAKPEEGSRKLWRPTIREVLLDKKDNLFFVEIKFS